MRHVRWCRLRRAPRWHPRVLCHIIPAVLRRLHRRWVQRSRAFTSSATSAASALVASSDATLAAAVRTAAHSASPAPTLRAASSRPAPPTSVSTSYLPTTSHATLTAASIATPTLATTSIATLVGRCASV